MGIRQIDSQILACRAIFAKLILLFTGDTPVLMKITTFGKLQSISWWKNVLYSQSEYLRLLNITNHKPMFDLPTWFIVPKALGINDIQFTLSTAEKESKNKSGHILLRSRSDPTTLHLQPALLQDPFNIRWKTREWGGWGDSAGWSSTQHRLCRDLSLVCAQRRAEDAIVHSPLGFQVVAVKWLQAALEPRVVLCWMRKTNKATHVCAQHLGHLITAQGSCWRACTGYWFMARQFTKRLGHRNFPAMHLLFNKIVNKASWNNILLETSPLKNEKPTQITIIRKQKSHSVFGQENQNGHFCCCSDLILPKEKLIEHG